MNEEAVLEAARKALEAKKKEIQVDAQIAEVDRMIADLARQRAALEARKSSLRDAQLSALDGAFVQRPAGAPETPEEAGDALCVELEKIARRGICVRSDRP